MKLLSLAAACVMTVTLSAETIKYNLQNEFGKNSNATFSGDVMTYKGPTALVFKPVTLDPKAKYTFSVETKQVDGAKNFPYHCGFYCYDKDGKQIYHENVSIVPGTNTVLAADVKVGDKTITVKNGAKWRMGALVAFNAKDDFSDLPNRALAGTVSKVERKGGAWVITLTKPVKQAYAAGTSVREHASGGYVYTKTGGKLTADWVFNSGMVTGVNPLQNGGYYRRFWPGTVQIRPMILVNWNWSDRNGAIQLRNVVLKIEK